MEKYIGQVIFVNLPNTKYPQWRWIIRKRNDNRYIVRVPKIHTKVRELYLKRDNDYGKEILLPIGSKPYRMHRVGKSKKRLKHVKNKTQKKI